MFIPISLTEHYITCIDQKKKTHQKRGTSCRWRQVRTFGFLSLLTTLSKRWFVKIDSIPLSINLTWNLITEVCVFNRQAERHEWLTLTTPEREFDVEQVEVVATDLYLKQGSSRQKEHRILVLKGRATPKGQSRQKHCTKAPKKNGESIRSEKQCRREKHRRCKSWSSCLYTKIC